MTNNRAPLILALLLLLFFVSTSAGFADVSSVQEQLRAIQLKIIGEKLKMLQQGVLGLSNAPSVKPPAISAPAGPTPEELSRALEEQIQTLQGVVTTLRPRAIEEETTRIEERIRSIGQELKSAAGVKLVSLQEELGDLIAEHRALEAEVRKELDESLRYKQAVVIGEQIRALQEKVAMLPRAPTYATPKQEPDLSGVKDTIEKLQLKLLQAQVKAIQEKVSEVRR